MSFSPAFAWGNHTYCRTYSKQSFLPHMQERMSLPFVFPKTISCISRSSNHILSVFLDDGLWVYWYESFLNTIHIYVVFSLGSTDDVFWTSICLTKPHLEHIENIAICNTCKKKCRSPSFFQRQILVLPVPVCIYGVFFWWWPVSILIWIFSQYYIHIYVVLGQGSTVDMFCTSICLVSIRT